MTGLQIGALAYMRRHNVEGAADEIHDACQSVLALPAMTQTCLGTICKHTVVL